MRKIILAAAFAAGALTLASCSKHSEQEAGEATNSAADDAQADLNATGDAIDAAVDHSSGAGADTKPVPKTKPTEESKRKSAAK